MKVEVRDVSVGFRKKEVLHKINLSLQPGVYGLIGENGAGKTTLFRSILGVQPYAGTIEKTKIRNVGYVPQKFDCPHGLKLREMLQYFCCLNDIPAAARTELIETLLYQVNLTEEKEKKVGALSGGMLRRLGIAQALIHDPELLVMDEPTVGLDPAERVRLRGIIEGIRKDRIVLISSHEIRELEHLCESFVFLRQGQIVCMASLQELRERYQTMDIEEIYFKIMEEVK